MEEAEEVFQAAENAGTPDHHPVSPVKVLTAVTGKEDMYPTLPGMKIKGGTVSPVKVTGMEKMVTAVSPVKVLTAVTGDRSFKLSSSLQGRKRGASLPQVH